jgi:DHA1 family bicyclomycin/chloramphenicol resistance-like MFS transporter
MFLYVLSAPEFLGTHLRLGPTEFFWFFLLTIAGIMTGAWASGRLAGRILPRQQVRYGFVVMFTTATLNLLANLVFTPHVAWALLPLAVFAFGWALNVPVVTLMVLDLYPHRRGMASSLQAVVGSVANGVVAGVIAPVVMHSTVALASTSLAMLCVGLFAWLHLRRRWPEAASMTGDAPPQV